MIVFTHRKFAEDHAEFWRTQGDTVKVVPFFRWKVGLQWGAIHKKQAPRTYGGFSLTSWKDEEKNENK